MYIIPSRPFHKGISALLSLNLNEDIGHNLKRASKALKRVKTGEVTYAARTGKFGRHVMNQGDILGLIDGKVELVGDDPVVALKEIVRRMVKQGDEIVTVYWGQDVDEETAAKASEDLEAMLDGSVEQVPQRRAGTLLLHHLGGMTGSMGRSLDEPVRYLKGVGPRRPCFFMASSRNRAGPLGPLSIPHRRLLPCGADGCCYGRRSGDGAGQGHLGPVHRSSRGRAFRVGIADGTGILYLVWYNMPYIHKRFAPACRYRLRGKWSGGEEPSRWPTPSGVRVVPVTPRTCHSGVSRDSRTHVPKHSLIIEDALKVYSPT